MVVECMAGQWYFGRRALGPKCLREGMRETGSETRIDWQSRVAAVRKGYQHLRQWVGKMLLYLTSSLRQAQSSIVDDIALTLP
jgi:hypothetical protein